MRLLFDQNLSRKLVGKLADFAERSHLYGSPPKVIWLRCGNVPTRQVEQILRAGGGVIQELEDTANIDCLELC